MLSPNGLCRPFYRGRLDRLREHCHPCTICEPRRGPASCVSIPWVAHTQSSVRMKVELTVRVGFTGQSRSAAGNPAIDFYERERGSSVLHCLADAGPAPRGVCGARDGHPRPHVARMCTKWRENSIFLFSTGAYKEDSKCYLNCPTGDKGVCNGRGDCHQGRCKCQSIVAGEPFGYKGAACEIKCGQKH